LIEFLGFKIDLDAKLCQAIENKNFAMVKQIVQEKQIDLTKDIVIYSGSNNTCNYLHYAIFCQTSCEIVEYLCKQGVNLHATFYFNRGKYTPIEIPLIYGDECNKDIYVTMFKYGAKLYRVDPDQHTLLDYFLRIKDGELYVMAKATVEPEMLRVKEKSILSKAVNEFNLETIKFFVETQNFSVETIIDEYAINQKYEQFS
jgi:ankyrin repeat protein